MDKMKEFTQSSASNLSINQPTRNVSWKIRLHQRSAKEIYASSSTNQRKQKPHKRIRAKITECCRESARLDWKKLNPRRRRTMKEITRPAAPLAILESSMPLGKRLGDHPHIPIQFPRDKARNRTRLWQDIQHIPLGKQGKKMIPPS